MKQVSAKELATTRGRRQGEGRSPVSGPIVELYPDRIDGPGREIAGQRPFRGVPFLIKDVFGHEKGRKIEFGSRCARA
jgi:hypothetical protein